MASGSGWETEVVKILGKIVAKRESDLFREAVDWEGLGLTDYLVIIKQPMDLGTVRKRLERGEYRRMEDCAADIRLIWSNSMLYNAPGSLVYNRAKALSDYWESQWSSFCKDDVERPPTTEEMQQWAENCHKISQEDLGKILSILESICPQSLVKKYDSNEVEVNVDLIGGKTFREVKNVVDGLLGDGTKKPKRARTGPSWADSDQPTAGGGGAAAAAVAPSSFSSSSFSAAAALDQSFES